MKYIIEADKDYNNPQTRVISDQFIRFSETKTKKQYPDTIRRIVYYNKDGNRTFVFSTNAFLLTAEMVVAL